jgi:transcriptional regulator with XRE-family HTH domain
MLEIGETLRQAREQRGLAHADVEAATLIPVRYLQALEADQFERLPEGLYRRSFLREYAEYLGLDGDVLVVEYELRFAPPEPEQPVVRPPRGRPRPPYSARAAAIGAAALVVVGALWWLGGLGGSGTTRLPATTSPSPPPRVPSTPAPRPHPRPRRTPGVLVLRAVGGNCWLSVQIGSAAGPRVFVGTLAQGGAVRFGLRRPLAIRIGAPWNLAATIGGRTVTAMLPHATGDVVASSAGIRATG